MLKLVLTAASANANGVLSWRMEFLEFVCHIFALKALVKTQNMDILQYSEWYWLLLSVNMTYQLLRTVLYTIPRKVRFTKRCFQKISRVLNRISLEKLLTEVFIFCFSVFIFLLLVLPLIPDAPTCFLCEYEAITAESYPE